MKKILTVLLTLTSFSALAADMDAEKSIKASRQYKAIQSEYKKMGGSFKCSDFQVVASTDLNATLSGYTMIAQSVVANCKADPNDGLDAISERLLSFVTVTTDHSEKKTRWNVESVSTVTPPQPD
ncbi:MAG: hypothetical protein IT287_06240 [Bdellovibrionaceae bacterium]|nr:hypothetical protein [Pseudobdellovibrionaceae bacterium]